MDRLYKMVEGYCKRFPEGVEPYQIVTRILEECGEVAKEVNHFEDSGIKRLKYGEPNKDKLANEVRQAVVTLMQLVVYYNIEDEFEKSIEASLNRMREEKLID